MGTILLTGAIVVAGASSAVSGGSKSGDSLGAKLTKSSAIKVGQTLVYKGVEPSHKTIEVILTRTKNGLVALDGTCTAKGETVILKRTQLICPSQGSVYQAATGEVVLGPNGSPKNSIPPLTRYTITEKSGYIWIK